ncbi:hypothetical protein GH714_015463 [Hevea brasiliensis]|uniref:Uncharacterized protein n=1 Tax=Hevea brasiliensis TaxID=3981 RepID=A0A6A6M8A3_HEVBR|nr:hypothetical protein GH714_015463 [Hevea brasiliensis]
MHVCPKKTLRVIIVGDDEETSEEGEPEGGETNQSPMVITEADEGQLTQLELPLFSVGGISRPKTMKIRGRLKGRIDSDGMSPFEAVYGRPPPNLLKFLPGETKVEAVAQTLMDRDEILCQLHYNLARAQQRMDIQNQFPSFNLEDKVGLSEDGNDMDSKLQVGYNGPGPLRVYSRRKIKENAKGMAVELDDSGRN